MKKIKVKKLYFNSLSVSELNSSQMRRVIGGDTKTDTILDESNTQTGPPDTFSTKCIGVDTPIQSQQKANR